MNIKINGIFYFIFCVLVSIIGYNIHHSIFWAIMDFMFSPLALAKWLILHQITLAIIKASFAWFF